MFREETGQEMSDLVAAGAGRNVCLCTFAVHFFFSFLFAIVICVGTPPHVFYTKCSPADIQDTLQRVTARLAEEGPGGVLVVCGTGYIMPQARAFLGIDEPR